MKPLVVLLIAFCLALLAVKLFTQEYNIALSARIAISSMLVFTSVGHFVFPKGMAMMLPAIVPARMAVVYITGMIELAAAVGLLITSTKVLTGWLLILFFILVLPANIYAAMKGVDYQKGTFDGNGLAYLWFRIPLQIVFIAWTYISCIRF